MRMKSKIRRVGTCNEFDGDCGAGLSGVSIHDEACAD